MSHKIEIEGFNGPLDLLLQLIEDNELEVTKISLAKVADQYIAYINENKGIPPEDIADFLVIAAKLIYLKSKALLPTLAVEEDGIDLEKQLKMYKQFIEASKKIHAIVLKKHVSFAKEKYPADFIQGFNPPKNLSLDKMKMLFEALLKRIEPVVMLPKRQLERIVSIKEKIQMIRDRIINVAKLSFQKIVENPQDKAEVIVSFLALLELVKQKIIFVDQDNHFSDIIITKCDAAETRSLVTDSEYI